MSDLFRLKDTVRRDPEIESWLDAPDARDVALPFLKGAAGEVRLVGVDQECEVHGWLLRVWFCNSYEQATG